MISRVDSKGLFYLIESNLATLEYTCGLSKVAKSNVRRQIAICQNGVSLIPKNDTRKVSSTCPRLNIVLQKFDSSVKNWCSDFLNTER